MFFFMREGIAIGNALILDIPLDIIIIYIYIYNI